MPAKMPITAKDSMISKGEFARTVIMAPMPVPKKQIIRAILLPKRSAKKPQGREKRPKPRYMGKPSFKTSSRFMFKDERNHQGGKGQFVKMKQKM